MRTCGLMRSDKIMNEDAWDNVGVVFVVDNMTEAIPE